MKILFTGDTVVKDHIYFSDNFLDLCKKHDYCITNLEAAFTNSNNAIQKAGPNIKSNPIYIDSLRQAFNCVTLANNHTMDYGTEGLFDNINYLKQNNFLYAGAGDNIEDAIKPIKLGDHYLISICENEFGSANINKPGVATVDNLRLLYNTIQSYKKLGKIILCYHGGSEIIPIPQTYLQEKLKLFIDFGIDLIIGHHPHVVQGYDDNIYYSLGNFYFKQDSFSQYPNSDWSLIVSYDTNTKNIEHFFTTIIEDKICLVNKNTELNNLRDMIISKEYINISNLLSYELYKKWYPDSFKYDIPLILHYIRCDAHRNNLITGLSLQLNEINIDTLQNFKLKINGFDSFLLETKIKD